MIPFAEGSTLKVLLSPLFGPGLFPLNSHTNFIMGYPPVPWLGIMLVGFATGKMFTMEDKRRNMFLKIGVGALILFIVLRFINIYGDSLQWSSQINGIYTFLSFMNVTKYPPSLLFCSVTLGFMFLILAFAERANNRFTNVVSVYGKAPFFYFLVHFYLIHFVMVALMFLQGFHWSDLDFSSGTFGRPGGVQSGVELWEIYLIWIAIVAILYKPCLWFGKYKAEHSHWWLRFI
jgi:hypothetical protein